MTLDRRWRGSGRRCGADRGAPSVTPFVPAPPARPTQSRAAAHVGTMGRRATDARQLRATPPWRPPLPPHLAGPRLPRPATPAGYGRLATARPGYGGARTVRPLRRPRYGSPPGWGDAPGWGRARRRCTTGPPVRVNGRRAAKRSTFIIVLCRTRPGGCAPRHPPRLQLVSRPPAGALGGRGDQEVARQINLAQSEVPSGWVARRRARARSAAVSAPRAVRAPRSRRPSARRSTRSTPPTSSAWGWSRPTTGSRQRRRHADADASSPASAPLGSTHIETGTNVVLFRSPAAWQRTRRRRASPSSPPASGRRSPPCSASGLLVGLDPQVGPQVTTLCCPATPGWPPSGQRDAAGLDATVTPARRSESCS